MTSTALAHLQHAAMTLRASGDAGDARVASGLDEILAGKVPAAALELDELAEQRRAERDRLIRAAIDRHSLTQPGLAEMIERYETTAWPREREHHECPATRLGRPEEFAWRILRLGPAPSARTIRRATSGHGPPFGGRST